MSDISYEPPVRVALCGAGVRGTRLARALAGELDVELAYVHDPDERRREELAARHPGVVPADRYETLLDDETIDAIVIASTPQRHAPLAYEALCAYKSVLIEAPVALSLDDVDELADAAVQNEQVLMAGYAAPYSEPIAALARMIRGGELGEVLYVYSQRLGLGNLRSDTAALWELGSHEVATLACLFGDYPQSVRASSLAAVGTPSDASVVVLEWEGSVCALVHTSRLDSRTVRSLTVVGTSGTAVYDALDTTAPLRIYEGGIELLSAADPREGYEESLIDVRSGAIVAPKLQMREPLAVEIAHFVQCVRFRSAPLTGIDDARGVTATLVAADRSSSADGSLVMLADVLAEASATRQARLRLGESPNLDTSSLGGLTFAPLSKRAWSSGSSDDEASETAPPASTREEESSAHADTPELASEPARDDTQE